MVGIRCTDVQLLPLKGADVDDGVLRPCSLMQNITTVKW